MKNWFARICTTLVFPAAMLAQKDMRSEDLAIGFKVPEDFKILLDDVEQFMAVNEHLELHIINGTQVEVLREDLPEWLSEWSATQGYLKSGSAGAVSLEDFWGQYIKGRNDRGSALLSVLLEKESQVETWLIVIAYKDAHLEDALSILNSFYRL